LRIANRHWCWIRILYRVTCIHLVCKISMIRCFYHKAETVSLFHMNLVFGVGYLFVCFYSHRGIHVSSFWHSEVHVFVLLETLYSIPEVWRPLKALLNANRSCYIFQIFISIYLCSNGSLNVWRIAPDAFTIVDTLNDMSFQHLCDTLQLLKLGLVAGILGNTKTVYKFILDGAPKCGSHLDTGQRNKDICFTCPYIEQIVT
jgi:hypothetical protein